ncbi:bifunctional [glutamate--ammonia ligase]-adenylyl-L-tyrosine phosphorylase/[glutamate--ammonia-ligase] adenylyltransferase [Telmatospirillum siberiense]|uniref:Bifunctional glutamine synthetase adenylyltransferase/adenylyl-removing enzyme n=2 Tax=Telmatospirillum siberiense TaxID=382514 RepID=A0A2N3PXS7_9PROT|nr:bifunctional [glutamate--ammonia ligase]-adenylyl-L-tyrosine phosphorylase/[glutamate--ammonia-ligase] adenylyltransferase [Telmatospirillum siberiense]
MAERNRERWLEDAAQWEDAALVAFARNLADDPARRRLLDAVFGNSPYLTQSLIREPDVLRRFLSDGPDPTFEAVLGTLTADNEGAEDTPAVMDRLRIAKRRAALIIGLADICELWPLEAITGALTRLADATLSHATRHLLGRAHGAGEIVLPHPDAPDRDCGLVILGMGKLGAGELNYSSDVDLIILYEEGKVAYQGRRTVQEFFVRLSRDLVRLMEELTGEGYVFRTDLRLRPDPGSTPLAISLEAAETYYEGFGQNWERAAMIKARPVAGDLEMGREFVKFLRPFIWRRHLDFAAIQDIHSIKRQINAHKGGGRIAVAGHNIKLGRGGIREIEFFAQTQQLIWGGRQSDLRTPKTTDALTALAAAGHVDPAAAGELIEAYGFLRRLEHRLQMIDDQQTQTLPEDREKLRALGVFLGFGGFEGFAEALTGTLRTVESHYAHLFEDAPPLSAEGNLVFTGGESDPETLKTITGLGFTQSEAICSVIRGWHHGRVRATRSTRAREMLTELTPALLAALARTADPDAAFHRFDGFLSRLPAGVPLFALFSANPSLLDLVAEIMGDAPRLAEWLSANTTLLDSVLTSGFFDAPPPRAILVEEASRVFDQSADYQEMLDVARRWVNEQKFRIGVQTLRNLLDPQQAGRHLSDLADAALATIQPRVEAEFALQYGRVPGRGMAIVAMGKMGSREMTATSDLDLILVYDMEDDLDQSDGVKQLTPSAYYARLTQRIINALTAKTGEGALYEVDMRLRPSGNAGPIATSLSAFAQYHANMAWTWEHLALTRARVITGNDSLRGAIEEVIRQTLESRRDPVKLLVDVADMRLRIAREHKADSPWEVKHLRGGLVDIEFIAQYLQLRWGADHPSLIRTNTDDVLAEALRLNLLPRDQGELLRDALRLWSAIQQVLRQSIEGRFDEEKAPGRLKEVLVRATGSTHFEGLRVLMDERARQVMGLYEQLIDTPVGALRTALGENADLKDKESS